MCTPFWVKSIFKIWIKQKQVAFLLKLELRESDVSPDEKNLVNIKNVNLFFVLQLLAMWFHIPSSHCKKHA